jgi:SAM-dependent methyltransferase
VSEDAGRGRGASSAQRLSREIAHHRRIAPFAEAIWSWSSPSGSVRAARRAGFYLALGELGPGKTALELGCGTGLFLSRAAASGAAIHAVDLSVDLLDKAREKTKGLPLVTLSRGNAEALPFRDSSFDAVYGSSILHHLDLDAALAELRRVLKPGGRLVFAEPNAINPHLLLIFRVRALRRHFGVSPDEMAFTRWRARRALARAGFVQVSVEPYDFLHPSTPRALIAAVSRASLVLERLPLVREIAGSLLLLARRG